MAIKIDFLADVAKFLRGTKDIGSALEDVADGLDDLGGDRALGKLEDGLQEAGGEAKDLESKVSQAMRQMGQDAQAAGKKVGDSTKQGFREASEGSETFKENAGANAKEVAASFDGSAESISDGFQGLAAEMLEGFGPAGLAAGVLVAAGIGMATVAMQDNAEAATEAKQRAVDMVDAIAEAGGSLDDVDLTDKIKSWGREIMEDFWLTPWVDESSTKFQEAAKDAEAFGVTARTAIRAASGSEADSRKFLDETADDWERLTKVMEEGRSVSEAGLVTWSDEAQAASKQRQALSDLRGQAEENIKTTENAVDIYQLETDALDATAEAAEAAAEAVKDKADATAQAASAAMDAQGSEISWIETLKQMTEDIKANGKAIDNNTQAGRDNNQSLIDLAGSANQYIASQVEAGGTTDVLTGKAQQLRDAFIEQAVAAGYPRQAAEDLATSYGLVPANVSTMVQAHGTEEAKAAVASVPAAATDAVVQVKASGLEQAQTGITNIDGTEVKAEVEAEGTQQTQQAIDAIKGKDVPITVSISNLGAIQAQLNALTAPRSVWVTVNERQGQQAP